MPLLRYVAMPVNSGRILTFIRLYPHDQVIGGGFSYMKQWKDKAPLKRIVNIFTDNKN